MGEEKNPSAQDPNVEHIELHSGLKQSLLFDFEIMVLMKVDHEGGGQIILDYNHVPEGRRLQALISLMGALTDRIAYALGRPHAVRFLRELADFQEKRDG